MKKTIASILAAATLITAASSAYAVGAAQIPNMLELTDESHFKLDRESGYIDMIDGTISADKLKSNFVGDVVVSSPDGTVRSGDDPVASDDIVSAGEDSINVAIYGDANRDGRIDLADAVMILKSAAGHDADISEHAADTDRDGSIGSFDAVMIIRKTAGWEDISLGNVRMTAANEKITAASDDPEIDIFFASPMLKVSYNDTESSGLYSYKMKLAKNESESCQVFLKAESDKEGLSAEMSDFEYEYGDYTIDGRPPLTFEIMREYYYKLSLYYDVHTDDFNKYTQDYYAEPLLPDAGEFELTAGHSQGFMLNVTSDKNAKPGMYRSVFSVKDKDGNTVKSAYVYVYIWDFTLPETPYSKSAFELNRAKDVIYEDYYEFLLNYNITPSQIPYDLRDSRADAYMDDPRVTSFRTCPTLSEFSYSHYFGEGDVGVAAGKTYNVDEMADYLVTTMDKISKNELWASKSYFTIIDEPYNKNMMDRIKNFDDWMVDVLGNDDYNLLLCISENGTYDEINYIDLVEFVKDYVDIWCPSSIAYTRRTDGSPGIRKRFSNTRSYLKYGDFIDRRKEFINNGNRMWWYICVDPEFPYPNYFNFYQGVINRLVLWQQYMFDIEGILYWSVNAYTDNMTLNNYGAWSGDGQLIYSGELYGLKGPIPGFRLIQIRDSFDDYDYMSIAEELLGRDAVMDIIYQVTKSSLNYTDDYRVLESARNNLGNIIEAAISEN